MSFLKTITMTAFAAVTLLSFGGAQANIISGGLWRVTEAASQNAIPANIPATAPDVTFDVNSPLNFSATGATVGVWLASGLAFNMHENTPGALSQLMDPSLVRFTGFVTVTHNQMFTVAHDDGLTLIIGGLDLGFNPGPTSPVVTTAQYTGPSGTFAFTLVYGECCGGPAVLNVDLPFVNVAVPEPASLALLGTGLAVFGWARRRFA